LSLEIEKTRVDRVFRRVRVSQLDINAYTEQHTHLGTDQINSSLQISIQKSAPNKLSKYNKDNQSIKEYILGMDLVTN